MSYKRLYLAGKMTGDPDFKLKFDRAAETLTQGGFIVMNPAILPQDGFTWEQYIHVSSAMLDVCETVCFLPDWKDSRGACLEYGKAAALGLPIILYDEWVQCRTDIVPHDDLPARAEVKK
jgi:nucleoside 2-deoxyribosyltransferase